MGSRNMNINIKWDEMGMCCERKAGWGKLRLRGADSYWYMRIRDYDQKSHEPNDRYFLTVDDLYRPTASTFNASTPQQNHRAILITQLITSISTSISLSVLQQLRSLEAVFDCVFVSKHCFVEKQTYTIWAIYSIGWWLFVGVFGCDGRSERCK